jgi:GNAT superfamily N-acetyltransferase
MTIEDCVWGASDATTPDEAAFVDESLAAFNRAAADLATVRPLGCFARLPCGRLIGGALARTWGGCCEIRDLFVDEAYRRVGLGTRLVRLVEEAARARGCALVFLETFSFQAPALYHRIGYEVACRLDGFPDGITKFVLRKELA